MQDWVSFGDTLPRSQLPQDLLTGSPTPTSFTPETNGRSGSLQLTQGVTALQDRIQKVLVLGGGKEEERRNRPFTPFGYVILRCIGALRFVC